jgi:hypothetical protein
MCKDSRVVTVPFSGVWDTCGSLPFIMDDGIDSNYQNFAVAYKIAPHVREVYSLDAIKPHIRSRGANPCDPIRCSRRFLGAYSVRST